MHHVLYGLIPSHTKYELSKLYGIGVMKYIYVRVLPIIFLVKCMVNVIQKQYTPQGGYCLYKSNKTT